MSRASFIPLYLVLILHLSQGLELRGTEEGSCSTIQKVTGLQDVDPIWLDTLRYISGGSKFHLYRQAMVHPRFRQMREFEFYYNACLTKNTSVIQGNGSIFGFGGRVLGSFDVRPARSQNSRDMIDTIPNNTPTGPRSDFFRQRVTLTDYRTFAVTVNCWVGADQRSWDVYTISPEIEPATQRLIEDHVQALGFKRDNFVFLQRGSCESGSASNRNAQAIPGDQVGERSIPGRSGERGQNEKRPMRGQNEEQRQMRGQNEERQMRGQNEERQMRGQNEERQMRGQNEEQRQMRGQNEEQRQMRGQNEEQQQMRGQNEEQRQMRGQNGEQRQMRGQNEEQRQMRGQNEERQIRGQNEKRQMRGQNEEQRQMRGQNEEQRQMRGQNEEQRQMRGQNEEQRQMRGQNEEQRQMRGQSGQRTTEPSDEPRATPRISAQGQRTTSAQTGSIKRGIPSGGVPSLNVNPSSSGQRAELDLPSKLEQPKRRCPQNKCGTMSSNNREEISFEGPGWSSVEN